MVGAMATAITKSVGTCKARRAPLAPETVAGPMATSHGGPATVDALAPRLFAALGAIEPPEPYPSLIVGKTLSLAVRWVR